MDDKKTSLWSPEWEQRYQYIQRKYDNSRAIGLDALKILLGTAITIAAVPVVFYDKITMLFPGRSLCWVYFSWIFVLLSVLLGFVAYLFVFEGYYHMAHLEAIRCSGDCGSNIKKYTERSNKMLNIAHWVGLSSAVTFAISLLCIILPISFKIFQLIGNKS